MRQESSVTALYLSYIYRRFQAVNCCLSFRFDRVGRGVLTGSLPVASRDGQADPEGVNASNRTRPLGVPSGADDELEDKLVTAPSRVGQMAGNRVR